MTGADSYGALYRNDGERFTDVSREAGLFQVNSGFSTTFVDYDGDGRPDLHVGRDGWSGPMPNSLFHNNGDGTFTDVAFAVGLNVEFYPKSFNAHDSLGEGYKASGKKQEASALAMASFFQSTEA